MAPAITHSSLNTSWILKASKCRYSLGLRIQSSAQNKLYYSQCLVTQFCISSVSAGMRLVDIWKAVEIEFFVHCRHPYCSCYSTGTRSAAEGAQKAALVICGALSSALCRHVVLLACFDLAIWLSGTGAASCCREVFYSVTQGRWKPLWLCLW